MRRLCVVMLVSALSSIVCLGATESLRNDSGGTAIGVTITFSEQVRITSYGTAVFPNQEPSGRSDSFTFSGGTLASLGRFELSWTPTSNSIESVEWQVQSAVVTTDPVVVLRPTEFAIPAGIHGVAEWNGQLILHEFGTGNVFRWSPGEQAVEQLGLLPETKETADIVVEGSILYAGANRALNGIMAFSLPDLRRLPDLFLGSTGFIGAELFGMCKHSNLFYVLGATAMGQQLLVFDTALRRIVQKAAVPETFGELVGLEFAGDALYGLAWKNRKIVRLDVGDTGVTLQEGPAVTGLTWGSWTASGNLRAFCITGSVFCFGTIGSDATLFVSPVAGASAPFGDGSAAYSLIYAAPGQLSRVMTEAEIEAEARALVAEEARAAEIPGLEYLGNPFAERLPDGSGWETARRVWDMQTFGERIYLGHGDVTRNSGPTPVWYWDCALETFVQEFTMDDEAILAFRVVGDEMLVAGSDATESWDFGNVYVHDGSAWTKMRTLPHAFHVNSFYGFDGEFFATITDDVQRWVLRSADGGQTWTIAYDDKNITTAQLFSFGGQLYLSWAKESGVLRYDGQTFSAVEGLSMFPGAPFYEVPRTGYGMHAFETFGTDLVYIGRTLYYVHSSPYVMHEMTQDGIDALPVGGPTTMTVVATDGTDWRRDVQVQGEEAYDIVVEDERCWILTNEMNADDVAATVRVYSSPDLVTWAKVLEFEAPTAASSFEVHGGYIYLGLGAGHPHTQTSASWGSAHPAAGRIYRYALP